MWLMTLRVKGHFVVDDVKNTFDSARPASVQPFHRECEHHAGAPPPTGQPRGVRQRNQRALQRPWGRVWAPIP
jgi:hypothetical protein